MLTVPELELLPLEIILAAGLKGLGLDPVEIEEVLVAADIRDFNQPLQLGIVLRFAQLARRGMLPELVRRTAPAEINGKGYRKANTPMDFSLMRADERTIIIARDELLGKMLANVAKPEAGRRPSDWARSPVRPMSRPWWSWTRSVPC